MEFLQDNYNDGMTIESFSKVISEKWNIADDMIKNYILSNISLSLIRNEEMKRAIDKIYNKDKCRYYNAVKKSDCRDHTIIIQGTLEQEIYARMVLGILLEAEIDNGLRNKIIKLLRKYYPIVYNSVKKHDKTQLKNKYMKMDITTRNVEAKFDAAIYLYFTVYFSSEKADQGFIISILNDIEDFEFRNIINQNIESELKVYKDKIQEIKISMKRNYGQVTNYKDILKHRSEAIRNFGEYLEDLLLSNKLNVNHIFQESKFISTDKIILSYVRTQSKNMNSELLVPSIISGIFMQSLINEYKKSRSIYFKDSGEVLNNELDSLKEKFNYIENENRNLKMQVENLKNEKVLYDRNLTNELNKLNREHQQEIKALEDKIEVLESNLRSEKKRRIEIENLREYELNANNDLQNWDLSINLQKYIGLKKIIIIGGDKEWRRKFRMKYPQIRTLNGFNDNFDISILLSCDYIFFYTKYMNHSTFYKAMNFIKLNKCKFGYIGRTNMDLVEQEIGEQINKYENN